MLLETTPVTNKDWKSFQRWLKVILNRYAATRGMRDSSRVRGTSGAVAIGKELRNSVATALAALVLHEKAEGNPETFLRPWVGSVPGVTDLVLQSLAGEHDLLRQHFVFGMWCQDEDCLQFIRPVSMRPKSAPDSVATSAVCGRRKCRCVTVLWVEEGGVWVRNAPALKRRSHPMTPLGIFNWVKRVQPPRTRPAPLIAPQL